MPWDRTRTGAVSSSRGPARWRARGAGAAAVGEAGEAGAGSARRGGAQTAGSGAAGEGSGAVTPGACGRGGAGGRTHPSPGRRWDAEDAGLDRTLVPGQNPAFQRLGAADPRVRTARPQRGARRTARGRGPERGCDPLRQDRVGRSAGAGWGGRAVGKGGSCISLGAGRGVVCAGCGVIPLFCCGPGRRWGVKDTREPPFSAPPVTLLVVPGGPGLGQPLRARVSCPCT